LVSKNSLEEDEYEFLGKVFDTDTGLVKEEWIRYFLLKNFILSGPLPKITPEHTDTETVEEKTKEEDKWKETDVEIATPKTTEEDLDVKSDDESSDEDIKSPNDGDSSSPMPDAPTFTRQVSEDSKLPQIIRQNSLLEHAELEGGEENKDQKKINISTLTRVISNLDIDSFIKNNPPPTTEAQNDSKTNEKKITYRNKY